MATTLSGHSELRIPKSGKELNAYRWHNGRSPDLATGLTDMGMMNLGSDLTDIEVPVSTPWAVKDHRHRIRISMGSSRHILGRLSDRGVRVIYQAYREIR